MRDAEEASQLVIELASVLIRTMQSMGKPWRRAFLRFEMTSSSNWGCNGSYETPVEVVLFDPLSDDRELFAAANDLGPRLRQTASTPEREILVFLVVVDDEFNYKIDFESQDSERWKITKRNAASGIPVGLAEDLQASSRRGGL